MPGRRYGLLFVAGALICSSSALPVLAGERIPVATTPQFAFHSDFAVNLNDALIAAGIARNDQQAELFHAGAEQSCFADLPLSARAGWDRAVDYYAEVVSPVKFFQRRQALIRAHLAGVAGESNGARDREFVEIAAALRSAAAPAYQHCRWSAQDAENREWIAELQPRLAAHETEIAARLTRLYRKAWDGLPIPVDVVETVNWAGANSLGWDSAPGGHLLISESYRGPGGLEIAFHEASHLVMGRNDPVQQALRTAAEAQGVQVPRDLWHPLLFYTTGETVRRALEQAGEPDYVPMIYEIYERSSWGRFKEAIDERWSVYLDGERTLEEAAADLIQAVGVTGDEGARDAELD